MTIEQFTQQWEAFKYQSIADGRFTPSVADHNPIFDDDRPSHDEKDFSFDYWVHCSWAARKVAEFGHGVHVDCGSYAYFAGLVSAFVDQVIFADIRGLPSTFANLTSKRADLTNMPFAPDSVRSLSCLHVLEHVGLGRYGDKIDASGDLKAARELTRILAPGGQLIMVLPMNEKPRVFFNAHRFYSALQVHQMFSGLKMVDHACIFNGSLVENMMAPVGIDYTGCMVFTK
jgi:SAM-dependent methyltransferase